MADCQKKHTLIELAALKENKLYTLTKLKKTKQSKAPKTTQTVIKTQLYSYSTVEKCSFGFGLSYTHLKISQISCDDSCLDIAKFGPPLSVSKN